MFWKVMCENDLLTYVTHIFKRIENKYFNNLVLFYGLLKKGKIPMYLKVI